MHVYHRIWNLALCSLIVLCPCSKSEALIVESNDITHVLAYDTEDTLYAFDLDNTLIETTQHLGSDEWFSHHIDHTMEHEDLSRNEAMLKFISLYVKVQERTQMRLVDDRIPDLLFQMQKNKMSMIGFTKRAPLLSKRTFEQIAPLGIDFSSSSPIKEEMVFENLGRTLFKKGILFVGHGMQKGPVLAAYLEKLETLPKRVVMIDDKLSHLENIASSLEPLGLDFIGIRYGKTDHKAKTFNPKIAELQLRHLEKILSDEQALHLLQLE